MAGGTVSMWTKLTRRAEASGWVGRCEVCCHYRVQLVVTHLWDCECSLELYDIARKDFNTLPASVKDVENGILVCRQCQGYFDGDTRWLRINKEGCVEVNPRVTTDMDAILHAMHGTRTLLAGHLGEPSFPTSRFLDLAYSARRKPDKYKRELMYALLEKVENEWLRRCSLPVVEDDTNNTTSLPGVYVGDTVICGGEICPVRRDCWQSTVVRCAIVGCGDRAYFWYTHLGDLPLCFDHEDAQRPRH